MYTENLMETFVVAKNAGGMKDADVVGEAGNMKCGDIMKLFLKVNKEGIITDAKFKTFGCVAAIVSTDVACDLIRGKTLNQALELTNEDILKIMGEVPKQKIHCSFMACNAIHDAVKKYASQERNIM